MAKSFSKHSVVFVTGSTGYVGRTLIHMLAERGHEVRALARPASGSKVPAGATVVWGDALDSASYSAKVSPARTFVHLVGVSHPNPSKANQFRSIDLVSTKAAIAAALAANIEHFVYVSVAQPAPVMQAYIEVRAECEALLRASGLKATILRPWYILGPGHRWPYLLLPVYWLLERIPATRAGAKRLGLVSLREMAGALVSAIENCGQNMHGSVRIIEVPEIRSLGRGVQD